MSEPEEEKATSIHLTLVGKTLWRIDVFEGAQHTSINITNIPQELRDQLAATLILAARDASAVKEITETRLQ